MNRSERHEQLVERVTNIIAGHQATEMGRCKKCLKDLYGSGGGMTLTRHHAERIVDQMGLVGLFEAAETDPQGE